MEQTNYCQNLWTQLGQVRIAQQRCASIFKLINTEGDKYLSSFRQNVDELEKLHRSLQETWHEYFIEMDDGVVLARTNYEALEKIQAQFSTVFRVSMNELIRRCKIVYGEVVELKLSEKQLLGTEPIAALDKLEELDLTLTATNDIRCVRNLARLKRLRFDSADDLSPLSGLLGLEYLGGRFTANNDLSNLKDLNRLSHIDFILEDETDLTPLSGNLPELSTVSVGGPLSTDQLEVLTVAPKLEKLILYCADPESLEPLKQAYNLKEVGLITCRAKDGFIDISPLAGLPLEKVVINHSNVKDLSPLLSLPESCRISLVGVDALAEDDQKEIIEKLKQRGTAVLGGFKKLDKPNGY